MRAFICDTCGKQYKPYFQIPGYGEGNTLTVVKVEKDGKMHGKMRFEMCPECMTKFYDMMAEHIVEEGSFADGKYFSGGSTDELKPSENPDNQ